MQGRSQPHSPGWARVPLSSFFPQISINFSSNFTYFLPHFGPPGGRVAHPGRPWLRHWNHASYDLITTTSSIFPSFFFSPLISHIMTHDFRTHTVKSKYSSLFWQGLNLGGPLGQLPSKCYNQGPKWPLKMLVRLSIWCIGSGVARAFTGGWLAHPEGQNEEENK